MTERDTRVSVFRELLDSAGGVWLTEYNERCEILSTNAPHQEAFRYFFFLDRVETGNPADGLPVPETGEQGPALFTNSLGMTFLSDWITERGEVLRIYNLGPVFLDNVTSRQLNEQIQEAHFSADMTTIFRDMIWELPVVPLSRFLEYGIMLHRAVTGEKITVSDFIFTEADTSALRKSHGEPEQADSRGAYLAEARFLKLVEEGNLNYKAVKTRLLAFGNSVRYASGDYLRQAKNSVIVFTALCSRAAIRGGLDAETAFLLNDRYIQAVEVAESLDEIREVQETMLEDFIRRVYRLRTREGVSPQIMATCDYEPILKLVRITQDL